MPRARRTCIDTSLPLRIRLHPVPGVHTRGSMTLRRLEGLRVAVLATDGFEQVEVIRPLRHLLRQGALVDIVSLHRGTIR